MKIILTKNTLQPEKRTMAKRNLIIAASVLIILAAVSQLITQQNNKTTDDKVGNYIFSSALISSFDEVIIEDMKEHVHLNKNGDQWTVAEREGFTANNNDLVKIVDELTNYKVAALVTKDKKRLDYFKVKYKTESGSNENTTGTQLILKGSGKEVFKMIAGKQRDSKPANPESPPHPDGTYVRIGEAETVYLIKENLNLETNPDEWIDKSIFKVGKDEVKSIRYELTNDRFELKREEKGKKLELVGLGKDEKTSDYEQSSLLTDLEDYKIDEIIKKSSQPEKELALKSVITVATFDDETLEFQLLAKEEIDPLEKDESKKKKSTYFIKVPSPTNPSETSRWKNIHQLGQKWLFKLDEWQAKRWTKTKKDFTTSDKKK